AHRNLWDDMRDPDGLKRGGRLVMLGTPNLGSFNAVQMLMGLNDVLKVLSFIDLGHKPADRLRVAASFGGGFDFLRAAGNVDLLYDPATYTASPVLKSSLDGARSFQRAIAGAIDKDRMVYIAGFNRDTADGIADPKRLAESAGYSFTKKGDGT